MKKYSIIYADPPWTYKVWSKKGAGRTAQSHYECMSKEDIQRLPIPSICEKDCVLFLWVTYPCLLEGLELIRKWGFTYKTCGFSWVKLNKKNNTPFTGMGYYTRANNEICLLATRGKPLKRISRNVHQVVLSKIRDHSRKPDEVRERIVRLFGDLPRVELFARQRIPGWDAWGNEVVSDPLFKQEENRVKKVDCIDCRNKYLKYDDVWCCKKYARFANGVQEFCSQFEELPGCTAGTIKKL